MSVRKDGDQWRYRVVVKLEDGRKVRISGTPTINTKAEALAAERAHIERVLHEAIVAKHAPDSILARPAPPTVREFAETWKASVRIDDKPSAMTSIETILAVHLLPVVGDLRIDAVTFEVIEDLKAQLKDKPIAKAPKGGKAKRTLSAKTVNNVLVVLRSLLGYAKKRNKLSAVPEFEYLSVGATKFDFLDFEESDRLLAAASGEWRTLFLVALRCGLRRGELFALRWEDVDLVTGNITVRLSHYDGHTTAPKSGKPRTIAMGSDAIHALKAHRHLRGPLVFCDGAGKTLTPSGARSALWSACRRAGLRRIGIHSLRHSFASQLVMRGVSISAVQELMGHASIVMTQRYAHLAPHVTRDAVRTLDRGNHVATAPVIGPNAAPSLWRIGGSNPADDK